MNRLQLILFLIALTILPVKVLPQDAFGSKGHPVQKHLSNHELLKYWGNNTSKELELVQYVNSFFNGGEQLTFFNLSEDEKFQRLSQAAGRKCIDGPMLGDVRPDGIRVWVRTLSPASVTVEVLDGKKIKRFGPVMTSKETDLSAVVKVTDLRPETSYSYSVLVNGNPIVKPGKTTFKTSPLQNENKKESTRIIFGSCFHRWGLGNEKLMAQMLHRKPNAALFIGDISVQDREGNAALHRDDYFFRSFNHGWNDFIANVPVYATWDDHDYFKNDKAGIPEGYTYQDKKNVWEVFRDSWNNPYYGFGDEGEGVFTHTSIGPFDVIMTDNRYFRKNEKGSFLEKEQMEWLKKTLLECKGDFIIVSCGSMWSDFVSEGKDSWGSFDPEGREDIFKFIEDNDIGATLFISGDRHGARGFKIPRSNGFSFYEFEAASLGARSGPPATSDNWDTQLFGIDSRFAFGEFTFIPDEKDPAVEFNLIDDDGNIIYEIKLKKSQLMPNRYRR